MERVRTLAELISHIESTYSNNKAFNVKKGNEWISLSTEEFLAELKYVTLALHDLGIQKGDMIGILADSTPNWNLADLAIMLNGAVSVPLFSNISHENFDFEVQQTRCKTLFFGGNEPKEMLSVHHSFFDTLIDLDNTGEFDSLQIKDLIKRGKDVEEKNPDLYMELRDRLHPDDMATIIYTSGSTGTPKGAVHTHGSLLYNINEELFKWDSLKDRYLSFLPLAHVFARMLNLAFIAWGVSVYYITNVKKVADACKEVKPTLMIVVPRLLEKIYIRMVNKVEDGSALKKSIGLWAFSLANSDGGLLTQLGRPLADKLVYSKLREVFGNELRVVLTGGSKLSPHLNRFFVNIGLPLYEGYGMTEAGMMSVNHLGCRKIGSIGLPLTDVHFKLTEKSEILVKSGSNMLEYYKNPEETAKTITEEGWIMTGDKGIIDKDGFLFFSGRLKEIYKSSTGEYISPVPIEQMLDKSPLIDMCMVVADDRKFASALIFPDFEAIARMKKQQEMENISDEDFLNSDHIHQYMQELLQNINKHLNHWEEIRAYRFLMETPTIETGELTPTMKIKRNIISQKYADLIESMYIETEAA